MMAPVGRRFGRPGLIGLAARTAVVAGTATAVRGAMVSHQAGAAAPAPAASAAPVEAPPAADGGTDVTLALERLATLRSSGAIDDAEFAAAKAKILG